MQMATARDMRFRALHTATVASFVLAAVLVFTFALDVESRVEHCRYARQHGEVVPGQVIGHYIEPNTTAGLQGPGLALDDPCFVHIRFRTRQGYSYNGAARVSRATWEALQQATPKKPVLVDVCVPPIRPDYWVLHRDAIRLERRYRLHRNLAVLTGGVLLLLAGLGVAGAPAIERINRFFLKRLHPGPYGLTRRNLKPLGKGVSR
jgi:hypothetical protein